MLFDSSLVRGFCSVCVCAWVCLVRQGCWVRAGCSFPDDGGGGNIWVAVRADPSAGADSRQASRKVTEL